MSTAEMVPLAGFDNVPMVRPRYEMVIAERIAAVSQQKSWDAFSDVFSPAWDELRDDPGDLIALTVAFLEFITGEPVSAPARVRIAQGVRAHGKAIMYGIGEAVMRVDDPSDPRSWFPYALKVARSTVAKQRAKERAAHA